MKNICTKKFRQGATVLTGVTSTLTLLSVTVVLTIVIGCNSSSQLTGKRAPSLPSYEFKEFCELAGLKNCDFEGSAAPSQEAWDAGLVTFKTIVESPSKIYLTRDQFDREAVKNLIEVTKSQSVTGFLNSLPWELLDISSNLIELYNSKQAQVSSNGLTFIARGRTAAKIVSSSEISFEGLSLYTEAFGKEHISRIDLATPARVTIRTSNKLIKNIPIEYLIPDNFPAPEVGSEAIAQAEVKPNAASIPGFEEGMSIEDLITAIADVMFEEGYEWHHLINIRLLQEHIQTFKEISYGELKKNPFHEAIFLALDSAKSLIIGGPTATPLRLSMSAEIKCKMHFTGIPVLGNIKAGLNFSDSFGITSAEKDGTKLRALITGISTTIGNVKHIELDGDKVTLKVGKFDIPIIESIPFENESSISLDKVVCAPREK